MMVFKETSGSALEKSLAEVQERSGLKIFTGCVSAPPQKQTLLMAWVVTILFTFSPLAALDSLQVTANCPWDDQSGYAPIIVTLDPRQDQTVDIDILRGGSPAASDRLECRARQQFRQTILVPSHQQDQTWFQLRWSNNLGESGSLHCSVEISYRDTHEVLLSDNPARLAEIQNAGFSDAQQINPEQAPDRWQGYPSWLTVIVDGLYWDSLSVASQRALRTSALVSGNIFLLDDSGRIDSALPRLSLEKQDDLTRVRQQITRGKDMPGNLPYFQRHTVPDVGANLAGLSMILAVLFFLLAGPLNLWWAKRDGRLQRVVVRTPLFAAGTCLVLIFAGIFAEGVSTRRAAIQVVDLANGQSVVGEGLTLYAPLAPGSFPCDPSTLLCVRLPNTYEPHHRWQSDATHTRLDWTQGQTAAGDWVPSRNHRMLVSLRPVAERRRIQLHREADGRLLLFNGLDVGIDAISLRDADGLYRHAEHIPAGGSAPLLENAIDLGLTDEWHRLPPAIIWRWRSRQDPLEFQARLQAPLHPPSGPPAIDEVDPQAWLCGRLAGPRETQP